MVEFFDFLSQDFIGVFPAQGLAISAVQQAGDVVEFGLAELREVGALWQELARAKPLVFSLAWAVNLAINRYRPGSPTYNDFVRLRDLMMMIQKGAKWPPDFPPEVREQMRARGEIPVVPRGHTR